MLEMIVFLVFIIACSIQLLYWLLIFRKLAFYRTESTPLVKFPPVSLVICAKNEYHNLQKYLPKILTQDYPTYEVLVVNDDSRDETLTLLRHYEEKHKHLRVISTRGRNAHIQGKKRPLSIGIAASRYEILLLTDADCYPSSPQWIRSMVGSLDKDKEIVLGYSPYISRKGFLNYWVQIETTLTAIQYLSYALKKIPYMGVGRNILYIKDLYAKNKGFEGHSHIKSGDDDLFINAVATPSNTNICITPKALTLSEAPTTWSSYIRQKKRHYSTGSSYRPIHQFLLALYAFSNMILTLSALTLLFLGGYNLPLLLAFGTIFILKWILYSRMKMKLGTFPSYWKFFLGELLIFVYYAFFSIMIIRRSETAWK